MYIGPIYIYEGPMLETLDYTIRIGSIPTFLYFDLYLYSAYAAHFVYTLKHSGFRSDIEFLPNETHTPSVSHKKNRTRNITWFNPPFSKNAKTNVQ